MFDKYLLSKGREGEREVTHAQVHELEPQSTLGELREGAANLRKRLTTWASSVLSQRGGPSEEVAATRRVPGTGRQATRTSNASMSDVHFPC